MASERDGGMEDKFVVTGEERKIPSREHEKGKCEGFTEEALLSFAS